MNHVQYFTIFYRHWRLQMNVFIWLLKLPVIEKYGRRRQVVAPTNELVYGQENDDEWADGFIIIIFFFL